MKGFLWSSKNKKSSTSKNNSTSNGKQSSALSSLRNRSSSSLSTSQSSSSGLYNILHGNTSSSNVSTDRHTHVSKHNVRSTGHLPADPVKRESSLSSKEYQQSNGSRQNLSDYLSDGNSRSARSIVSTSNNNNNGTVKKEDTDSIISNETISVNNSTTLSNKNSHDVSKDSIRSSTLSPISSTQIITNNNNSQIMISGESNRNDSITRTSVHLNDDNYDTTIFKVGWINRSHGQIMSSTQSQLPHSTSTLQLRERKQSHRESVLFGADMLSQLNSMDSDSNRDTIRLDVPNTRNSFMIETQTMIPDYRTYRAELKGCLLHLYKSGLSGGIKYFDPASPHPAPSSKQNEDSHDENTSRESSNSGQISNKRSTISNSRYTLSSTSTAKTRNPSINENIDPKAIVPVELKYLSEKYPHPNLKLDDEGRIVGGDVESLCHAVLFSELSTGKHGKSTSKKQRTIINLLLLLPLVDYFFKFLNVFNQFGLTFTKHKAKLTATATQYYNTTHEIDDQITERLALVVKTILDILPSFLLDDQILQTTISLLNTISLHNDEISNNLKISVANKHNELTSLTSYIRPDLESDNTPINDSHHIKNSYLNDLLNFNKFLALDIDDLASEIHKINLKFDKIWTPRADYSLLYSSKYTNPDILVLNPLVFNNSENLHFLGRLLVSHFFPSDSSSITPKIRAKLLMKWVNLGCKFERWGDMVSWLAIATVICSIPILRLFTSWQYVPESTLKIIFKDWVPTIVQLDRRQSSSKSTNSVFILAPPNLNDPFIGANVISYFGDLIIHADDLPQDVKFKYLEKKINRTKNAFHKWQQRLQSVKGSNSSSENSSSSSSNIEIDATKSSVYQFWRYHVSQPPINIQNVMKLSLMYEAPVVDPKLYSEINTGRSALLTGSYLPILFNELLPTYSLFPQSSLIGAAGPAANRGPQTRSSARFSTSGPTICKSPSHTNLNSSNYVNNTNQVTGIGNIDGPTIKELVLKQSTKQILMKSIRDMFNIDTNLFHVSDDLVFKSSNEEKIISRPASVVLESPRRFSQQSFANNSASKESRDENRLSKTLENMNFFDSIGSTSDTFNESLINVVLKSTTLEKSFDLLVLTANVFSKLVDTKDLESFYLHKNQITNSPGRSEAKTIGLLDYAFIKLVLDTDIFTETFFNSYKSFTTTVVVLENLAKRYIGAKACAIAITKMLDSDKDSSFSSKDQSFPVWDMKIPKDMPVNNLYLAKIQIGAAEALQHLVVNHYSDFTDDLKSNSTLFDILKVMEQEVTLEWPTRLKEMKSTVGASQENHSEVDTLVEKLTTLFSNIKSTYQKELYRPVGINKTQRKITEILESFKTLTYEELQSLLNSKHLDDNLLSQFQSLKFDQYENMLDWVFNLNNFIAERIKLVKNRDWFIVYQVLELESSKSLTSFYCYPLNILSSNLVNSNSSQLKELEILNVFTWISTLVTSNEGGKEATRIFEKLPNSIQILIKLHCSLTSFLQVEIANSKKTFEQRNETCAVLLQILNFVRWKNSSLDLFETTNSDDTNALSPHIPSFLETTISNAMLSPESRNFEQNWIMAHSMLSSSNSNKHPLKSIQEILDNIDDQHLKSFIEFDNVFDSKSTSFVPCPGWIICRLLEISQFVPNMSISNSRLINFDKRRFVNNIISNVSDLMPVKTTKVSDHSGYILMNDFQDPNKLFRNSAKETALSEAKSSKFQETGLFNSLLQAEVQKIKREQRKLDSLRIQERDAQRASKLQQDLYRQKNRSSTMAHNIHLPSNGHMNVNGPSVAHVTSGSGTILKSKRNYAENRGSVDSVNSNVPSSGVGKKLGGFFRRPFSMAGFSTYTSNYSLNSSLAQDPSSKKVIQSYLLPNLTDQVFNDSKPVLSIKTFDIKSIVEIMNHRNIPAYSFSFKVIMQDGHEYSIQATSSDDLHEWIKMIKASKRYSFHSKKYKGKTSNKVFGVPLEDICAREGTVIPAIIVKLLEEIELRGLDEVGLYRIPGSVGSINALKNAFDEEGAKNNTFTLEDDRWFEINAIAGCFKMYLRELPDSLFSNEKVNDFTRLAMSYKASEISFDAYKIRIVTLLKQLPICYYQTMKRIVLHLNRVHQHVSSNRMDASNLAIVFSMSFIDQEDLASSMGPTLGAVQTILQAFIRSPGDFFVEEK